MVSLQCIRKNRGKRSIEINVGNFDFEPLHNRFVYHQRHMCQDNRLTVVSACCFVQSNSNVVDWSVVSVVYCTWICLYLQTIWPDSDYHDDFCCSRFTGRCDALRNRKTIPPIRLKKFHPSSPNHGFKAGFWTISDLQNIPTPSPPIGRSAFWPRRRYAACVHGVSTFGKGGAVASCWLAHDFTASLNNFVFIKLVFCWAFSSAHFHFRFMCKSLFCPFRVFFNDTLMWAQWRGWVDWINKISSEQRCGCISMWKAGHRVSISIAVVWSTWLYSK